MRVTTLTAIRSAGTNYRTMQKLVIALMLSRAAAAKTGDESKTMPKTGDESKTMPKTASSGCVPGDLLQMRCEGTATYQVKFTGQWTAENFPVDYPENAHWSPPEWKSTRAWRTTRRSSTNAP